MNELHLFAGAGGGILGGQLLGHTCVCAVEWDAYARRVLLARQRDGSLPRFPIWDDVQTFDGTPWRGRVDVVAGGFPCQDISAAGKGAGIDGDRSGMWRHMARIIGEVRPRFAFVENSPVLTSRGLGVVLGDLAALGYDAEWCVLGASDAGAPHRRERIWILAADADSQRQDERRAKQDGWDVAGRVCQDVADADSYKQAMRRNDPFDAESMGKRNGSSRSVGNCGARCQTIAGENTKSDRKSQNVADADRKRFKKQRRTVTAREEDAEPERCGWWGSEPDVGRVANGVAARVDRLRCIGNGQVPAVAALAWQTLMRRINE
ncbi:DNA cytosine methyltransferase [Janthinobacterium sp.]|uniref:DNA cytosine methyltransferase n=1 Tax=Janthinobacterium sp. TaxID=1871054 RepID=UPI0025C5560A|nr:DNA cytosine methyltransferase [Janthinobacterium sp.]NBV20261.1 DNA cytosine methyltransferase [Janthinobacterium sp.]